MIIDLNRKISLIQYNILNLPKKISFSNGAFEEMTYIMGSDRMVLSSEGVVEQQNFYYPFGASRSDSKNERVSWHTLRMNYSISSFSG